MFKKLIIFYYLLLPLIVLSPNSHRQIDFRGAIIDIDLRFKKQCKIPAHIKLLSKEAKRYRKQIDSVLKIKIHNIDSIRQVKRKLYSRTYKHDKNHKK